jgi:RNA polymerase sigma-70 factor, ECF subfamily
VVPAFDPVLSPLVNQNEAVLVAQARSGDPDAWDRLLGGFQLRLYVYARELLHDDASALDAVQESFVSAVRHLGSLRDDHRFASWIFGILHQRCLQQARRRGRESRWIDASAEAAESLASSLDPLQPDPLDALLHREQEADFLATLAALPEPQRALLLLRFLDDFSLDEIAEITGVPVGTVKSRLHHARTAFRKLWTLNQTAS